MLDESGCGEFIPAGDVTALREALCRYVEIRPEALAEMGAAGRRWLLANRSWDILAVRYLAIIDSLCEPGTVSGKATD